MDSSRFEAVPSGAVNLNTVRSLHQTVVSLRTALEVSKNELRDLKEKYEQHSNCIEYADVIEKLTLENHILRRKIIDSGFEKEPDEQNIKLEFPYSSTTELIDNTSESENRTTTEKFETVERIVSGGSQNINSVNGHFDQKLHDKQTFCSTEKFNSKVSSESPHLKRNTNLNADDNTQNTDLDVSVSKEEYSKTHKPNYKRKLELFSKFDVKINVRTLNNGSVSSTTSDTDSFSVNDKKEYAEEKTDTKANFHSEEKRGQFVDLENQKGDKVNFKTTSKESIKMAVPNEGDVKSKADKFDVQVRITSEENLVVKENLERSRRKDTLNLDVDDLSLRSLSEGDNSVFSEGGTSPIDTKTVAATEDKLEHEASGNESEEVDDIELIFTTDESKDMSNLQEDLVSIRETDHWAPQSASTAHSTPVLIKFHTLDPDSQPGVGNPDENNENTSLQTVRSESSLRVKRVSLPNDKEIRHVAFHSKGSLDLPGRGILKSCDNRSDNMLYKRSPNMSTRRLDSVDSLTCEYNRGLSLDNTKSSSFELGSSMDILHRDDSVDSFHRTSQLGHRFSVFAERDISKCGTSEDDLTANLNFRRNTCPNPFQFRAGQHRSLYRGGPLRAGASGTARARPVLRECGYPRRESGAQTDVSALPPRWSSDGHLAHKLSVPRSVAMPTLPQRAAAVTSRRVTAPDARPAPLARRCDEARRVLLSDIGFTSMVPELSRSADPVWALAKRMPSVDEVITNSTSKFLSRGSSYRSPSVSIDRSNEWAPNRTYVPVKGGRTWRSSLPDVRNDDTEELLDEAETYIRRSIDNLQSSSFDFEKCNEQSGVLGQPYIPAEPRHLRLGHTVKVITPHGRIAVGRVRYVGIAGGTATSSGVVVGAEFIHTQYPGLARNDGTYRGRRYFLASPLCTALFVPFSKVVMAWAI